MNELNKIGLIKLRNINELVDEESKDCALLTGFIDTDQPGNIIEILENEEENSPNECAAVGIPQQTLRNFVANNSSYVKDIIAPQSSTKKQGRSNKKQLLPGQQKIDNFFKSGTKTYKVETIPVNNKSIIGQNTAKTNNTTNNKKCILTKPNKGKKRLFNNTVGSETTNSDYFEPKTTRRKARTGRRQQPARKAKENKTQAYKEVNEVATSKSDLYILDTIDLCADSESNDDHANIELKNMPDRKEGTYCTTETREPKIDYNSIPIQKASIFRCFLNDVQKELKRMEQEETKTVPIVSIPSEVLTNNVTRTLNRPDISIRSLTKKKRNVRAPRSYPPYKVVEDTTFAVDAFKFGDIPNVTHYFLTHYHVDHYQGLSGTFCQTLYASEITVRLVREFIPRLDPKYLHILQLNVPIILNEVQVTAIDANHCPGAIMLVFKLKTGKCILHTGDFRACAEMESEPILWNNSIQLLYLDTTYLSDKYNFCHQCESISSAINQVQKFREKHMGKRILYICGAYIIGKEKMWKALALEFQLNVWAEPNRYKALRALNDPDINSQLCKDRDVSDLHIISIGMLNYANLVEYFKTFDTKYDLLLAIRPSGWEKDTKPQYRGTINIIGIEYSEHSSYKELERFVRFIKPERVISTVPANKDLYQTSEVPEKWYNYDGITGVSYKLQLSITTYFTADDNNNNENKSEKVVKIKTNNMRISPVKRKLVNSNSSKVTRSQIGMDITANATSKRRYLELDEKPESMSSVY